MASDVFRAQFYGTLAEKVQEENCLMQPKYLIPCCFNSIGFLKYTKDEESSEQLHCIPYFAISLEVTYR
jgi:hypothetical protein